MPAYVALRCFPVVASMGLLVEGDRGACVQASGFVSKGQVCHSSDFIANPKLLKLLRLVPQPESIECPPAEEPPVESQAVAAAEESIDCPPAEEQLEKPKKKGKK